MEEFSKRFPDQSTYSDEVFNEVYANINAYVWRLSVEDVESVIWKQRKDEDRYLVIDTFSTSISKTNFIKTYYIITSNFFPPGVGEVVAPNGVVGPFGQLCFVMVI